MPIDTTKIEGYADMTPEQKVQALEAYEVEIPAVPDTGAELTRLKTALSRANGEAADWKKKFRETQTEAERAAAERQEQIDAIVAENAQLKADRRTATYTQRFMALGYDQDSAAYMASVLPDGVGDDYFERQKVFLDSRERAVEARILTKQPELTPGTPPTKESVEDQAVAAFRNAALGKY